jgi:cytochrome bd-type quinol oxidase subunit 1
MRRLIFSILFTAIFVTLAFVNFDSVSAKPKESADNKEKKEEKSDKDKKDTWSN